ncbi:hypothetical protein KKD72_02580, partial [Patescibacteria group bacterium]|nr:hypothetical protein [Patescibacteria group bacterium]
MSTGDKYYLKIGKATDLKSPKDRFVYRAFEIVPGALAWGTLGGVILLSWAKPVWIAVFIIAFDVYWLLKTIYLSLHLRSSYFKMKKNMSTDWQEKLKEITAENKQDIYHLIVLPVYKESEEVVEEGVKAIINSDYSKNRMIVVLAIEERVGQSARNLAASIEKKFGDKFYQFMVTVHPDGIAGELAGKGANTAWAARQVKKEIIDPLKIPYQNIIVSCFDIDTVVFPKYFSCLTYHYLTSSNPTKTSYQPVPLYNNNIWQAPAISRVVATSGTFWQMVQQQRPERLSTFSSQSISFKALVDVGFWQTNMVSEDSRIFWQCLLYYDGNYQTEPLYYPVSMDANLTSSFLKTVLNV